MISTRSAKNKSIVGLDIEASSIAATELVLNGRPQVRGFGVAPIDSGLFRDGEVHEPAELSAAIKDLFGANKLSKDVRLGVANQRIAVRTLTLPQIDDPAELETAVRFQAEDHVPIPLDQAILDWQVIPARGIAAEQGNIEVVVVVARRDMIAPLVEAVEGAGLRLAGIDLSAFAMIRALAGEARPQDTQDSVGADPMGGSEVEQPVDPMAEVTEPLPQDSLVDAGAADTRLFCHLGDLTNLAVARDRYCLFTRVFNFGIEGIAQGLAERTGMTLLHARQWLLHVGLDVPEDAIEGDPDTVAVTRDALASGTARLTDEVRRTIEYFGASDAAVPVEGIVVAGPGTAIPGLVDRMKTELPLPLEAGNPSALATAAGSAAPRLTLAYGLGLEE